METMAISKRVWMQSEPRYSLSTCHLLILYPSPRQKYISQLPHILTPQHTRCLRRRVPQGHPPLAFLEAPTYPRHDPPLLPPSQGDHEHRRHCHHPLPHLFSHRHQRRSIWVQSLLLKRSPLCTTNIWTWAGRAAALRTTDGPLREG